MECSVWRERVRSELRARVFNRRTAQLVLTAVTVVTAVLVAVWLFSPPADRVEDSLSSANAEVTTSPPATAVLWLDTSVSLAVHVAGEVASPGVHQMPVGSRVIDAINAADGPTDDAELDALNLAAFVADGDRLYVPSGQALVSDPFVDLGQGVGSPINVNKASAIELESLPGVGPATADQIIREREANGPFSSIDDLTRVSGIGPATVEKLRDVAST
ncbi:MAG: helix-hairpin-helix domain-containing protein [Ilumatobacteraceae bacterium]